MIYDYDDACRLASALYKERGHASSGQYLNDFQDAEAILSRAEDNTPVRLLVENPEMRIAGETK